jgi:hypothetical protein
MAAKRFLAIFGTASALIACGAPSSVPAGSSQLVEIRLQPAVVPPNPQGALALGVVTGCVFEFLGPADAERTFRYRVQASQRVPEVATCIDRLKGQPGVEGVTVR